MRATAAAEALLSPWTITYHRRQGRPEARLWCNGCVKHVDLPAPEDRVQFEDQHRCGPLSTPWGRGR